MISAVILAKNEEKNILRCLQSLFFVDEVVVIDDNSIDGTVKIAKKYGAVVYKKTLDGDFSKQRNFALKKVSNDWVLFVDADEVVTRKLQEEITSFRFTDTKYSGFYIKRRDYFLGRQLMFGETGDTKLLRLARRRSGRWIRKVHEVWDVKGNIGIFENYLIHYPHATLTNFINSINRYSKLHAEANFKENKKSNIIKIVFFPKLKFLRNYFIKGGCFDGVQGFLHAVFMSFHSFGAWSKLWLMQKNKK